jgi:hypothetical protein
MTIILTTVSVMLERSEASQGGVDIDIFPIYPHRQGRPTYRRMFSHFSRLLISVVTF